MLLSVLALPVSLSVAEPYVGTLGARIRPAATRSSHSESAPEFNDTLDFADLTSRPRSMATEAYDDTLDFSTLHQQFSSHATAPPSAAENSGGNVIDARPSNSPRPVATKSSVAQRAINPPSSPVGQQSFADSGRVNAQPAPSSPAFEAPEAVAAPRGNHVLERPKIIFNPVAVARDAQGNSVLRPKVQLADGRLMSENLPSLKLAQHEEHSLPVPPQARSPRPNNVRPQPRFFPQSQPISRPPLNEPTYAPSNPEFSGEFGNYMVADDGILPTGEQDYSMYPADDSWQGTDCCQGMGSCQGTGCCDTCSTCGQGNCGCGCGPGQGQWHGCFDGFHNDCCDIPGIGREHVMNALFFLDTTQPLNNCRIRLDAGDDWEFPDRAEYFWARTPFGRGPVDPSGENRGEPAVDYQDMRFYIERGGKRFSIGTELPIRSVDPELRLNSTGFADMNLTTKALLLDGRCWQLTQVFRTYFPTGSAHRGTGNGHFAFEPGVAARYKISDITYLHGDLTYWFPVAGDPEWQGQILNAGIGISHVLYDDDRYAIIPTFEIDSWTVLDGRETIPYVSQGPSPPDPADLGLYSYDIDTISIVNLHPGIRFICDKGCDCGTKEFGIAGGVAVSEDQFYSAMVRLEFRWTH